MDKNGQKTTKQPDPNTDVPISHHFPQKHQLLGGTNWPRLGQGTSASLTCGVHLQDHHIGFLASAIFHAQPGDEPRKIWRTYSLSLPPLLDEFS